MSSILSPNPANVVPPQQAKHCSHLNLVPGSKTSFADQVPCSLNAFEMQLSCYVFHHGQSRVDHIAHSLISSISRQCQPTTASFVSSDNHGLSPQLFLLHQTSLNLPVLCQCHRHWDHDSNVSSINL